MSGFGDFAWAIAGVLAYALDREIELGARRAGNSGLVGAQAEILDRDGVEPRHYLVAQLLPERSHHPDAEFGTGVARDRVLAPLQRLHHPHDLAHGDAPTLACEAIAAAWATHARQDARAHELLQHRLQVSPRDPLPARDLRRLHLQRAGVVGDVQHGFDREQELLADPHHADQRPVEPKPRSPRPLVASASSGAQALRQTGASTNCATRAPPASLT